MIFSGEQIVSDLEQLGVSDVIWIPDSDMGTWEAALESSQHIQLLRVCREGEAWPLAVGLQIGGRTPIVVMQTTGLFESGDALRNAIYDLKVPLFAIIGARNWLQTDSADSAKTFAEPILKAWGINYVVIESPADCHLLQKHFLHCREGQQSGAILLAE